MSDMKLKLSVEQLSEVISIISPSSILISLYHLPALSASTHQPQLNTEQLTPPQSPRSPLHTGWAVVSQRLKPPTAEAIKSLTWMQPGESRERLHSNRARLHRKTGRQREKWGKDVWEIEDKDPARREGMDGNWQRAGKSKGRKHVWVHS